jgi:hypothetical protein
VEYVAATFMDTTDLRDAAFPLSSWDMKLREWLRGLATALKDLKRAIA